jgi:polysaccharide export outer membrane protein
LTTTELEKAIHDPLAKDYLVNPEVTVTVKEYHSLHYYISGAVKKPGLYEMTKEASLLELIAKAEGVKPDRGNVAYVMRKAYKKGQKVNPDQTLGKDPIKVDLKKLLDQGDMSANIMLKPADVVYIPFQQSLNLSTSKIYVDGEVKNPGVYDYQPGMTAMNACIMAGGFDKFAAPNRTRIIRRKGNKDEIIRINLTKVQEGKIDDIGLLPGDRIHVPETWL